MRRRSRTPLAFGALLALVAATVVSLVASAPAATNCSPTASWGTNRADLASQVVTLVNQYRAGKGLSQLSISAPLTNSSVWKSMHMAGYGYFDHNDPAPPVSRSAFQRARDCDYTGSGWGENIAWGYATPQSVMTGWLNSPGHRANIENASYRSIGVGVAANASGQLYWTQNFGTTGGSPSPPPPSPPPPSPPPPSPPAPPPPPPPSPPPAAAPTPPAPKPPAPSPPAPPGTPAPPGAPAPPGTQPAPVTADPRAPSASDGSSATLAVGGMPADVATVKARLAASVPFVELDTGKRFTAGSVRCRAEVSGRRLRVLANVFRAGEAHCEWRVPAWAKGKRVTGVVAVQLDGAAATRLFVRTVR
jgi:uncharacterized protein YkwD